MSFDYSLKMDNLNNIFSEQLEDTPEKGTVEESPMKPQNESMDLGIVNDETPRKNIDETPIGDDKVSKVSGFLKNREKYVRL